MTQLWYKPAVLLTWLPLAIVALKYWRVWDRLPMRMAVHFDGNWQPNGYTSRQGSLIDALGMLAAMQVLFTIAFFIVRARKPEALWPTLLFSYAFLAFFWYANNSIVEWNLSHPPAHSELMGPDFPAARDSGVRKFLTVSL